MPDNDLTFGQNIKRRHTILCRKDVIGPPNRATFTVAKNNTDTNVRARSCQSLQTGLFVRLQQTAGCRNKLGVLESAQPPNGPTKPPTGWTPAATVGKGSHSPPSSDEINCIKLYLHSPYALTMQGLTKQIFLSAPIRGGVVCFWCRALFGRPLTEGKMKRLPHRT